jgi:hypothetical protein
MMFAPRIQCLVTKCFDIYHLGEYVSDGSHPMESINSARFNKMSNANVIRVQDPAD